MKKILIAAAALLIATPAFAGSLYVIEHAATDATASVGKAKDNRGDILTFANPVFDSANKRQVGADNGFCIRTVAGAAYECIWTLKLADGQITAEGPFLRGNDAAMSRMMDGMTIKPSGDVDKDFVDMMVPHHQGAIDMAVLELRFGHNDRLKALAQEIIVTQQQEIAAMRLAVGEALPPSQPSPIDAAARSAQ